MADDLTTFRRVLIRSLKQGLESFDLVRLKEQQGVSEDVVREAARAVFLSQCSRASDDGEVTDQENRLLSQLGDALHLSAEQQQTGLAAAKNRVFHKELLEARDDGLITDEEAASLHELRQSLGLPMMDEHQFGPLQLQPRVKRRPKQQLPSRRARKNRRRSVHSDLLWATVLFVAMGPSFGLFGVFTEGWAWIEFLICVILVSGLGGMIPGGIYAWFFLDEYCRSCGSSWAVGRVAGESEERTGRLGFTNRYLLYECDHCGEQRWRKTDQWWKSIFDVSLGGGEGGGGD